MARRITTAAELETAFAAAHFLLFKHSTTCPISTRAFEEYESFLREHPEVESAWLHVVAERPLSQDAAQRTQVVHQSPQALWLRAGRASWHASHDAITSTSLAQGSRA